MTNCDAFPGDGTDASQQAVSSEQSKSKTPQQLAEEFLSVKDYDPRWAAQFQKIKADLESDLNDAGVPYIGVEHIGSTSVPGMASKAFTNAYGDCWREAVIDICIVIARKDFHSARLKDFEEALRWGQRQGGYFYIGSGGVGDRWSFKVRGIFPLRSVYVCAEDSIPFRSYVTLREVLRVDAGLRREYEDVKRKLVVQHSDNVIDYCNAKRPTIRKIFLKGGWTDAEVDEAEAQAQRKKHVMTVADYYEVDEEVLFGAKHLEGLGNDENGGD